MLASARLRTETARGRDGGFLSLRFAEFIDLRYYSLPHPRDTLVLGSFSPFIRPGSFSRSRVVVRLRAIVRPFYRSVCRPLRFVCSFTSFGISDCFAHGRLSAATKTSFLRSNDLFFFPASPCFCLARCVTLYGNDCHFRHLISRVSKEACHVVIFLSRFAKGRGVARAPTRG